MSPSPEHSAAAAPPASLTGPRVLTAIVPTLAGAALAGWLAATVGGAAAGVLAAVSVVLVAVASLSWPWRRSGGSASANALAIALAGLVLFFAFNAGGYFPGSTATATVGLLIAFGLRLALAERPVAGFGRLLALAALAIALLAVWQALSASWSGASARALLEVDRTLLYLSALLFFGSFARSRNHLEWLVRGLALALLAVCLAGLGVWLLPDRFAAPESFAPNRLSFPVTYWNTLGLLAALGAILAFHMAAAGRGPRAFRVLGAAALPLFATALWFTFSRGAILVGAIGLVVYVLAARRWSVVVAAVATVPAAAAVYASAQAEALASLDASVADRAAQGGEVAFVVLVCAALAAGLRAALLPVDRAVRRWTTRSPRARPAGVAAIAASLLLAAVVAVAVGAPSTLARYLDRFSGDAVVANPDARQRLLDPSGSGRLPAWRIAIDRFAEAPARGAGAGTFSLMWEQERAAPDAVTDAHSLPLEVGAELGVVGVALLVVPLALIVLVGLASRLRRRDRAIYAALLAVTLAWAARAAIDWDWEMPVVTLPIFALGGAALARAGGPDRGAPRPLVRVLAGCLVVVVAILPASIAVSEARLERARAAYGQGNCGAAASEARASANALPSRAEPYELIGFCEIEAGRYRSATASMQAAADRDPQDWRYRFGLAVAKGAAGDGGGAARAEQAARLRNPLEPTVAATGARSTRAWREEGPGLLPNAEP